MTSEDYIACIYIYSIIDIHIFNCPYSVRQVQRPVVGLILLRFFDAP